MFAALASPAALTLNYEFGDGPAKTVYSYEQTSVYTLETSEDELSLKNEEVDRAGVATLRNEYKLRRLGRDKP